MQMMYEIVAQELKSMNYENAHPQDYLNFYCLGNREELPNPDSHIDEQQLDKGAAVSPFIPFAFHSFLHCQLKI